MANDVGRLILQPLRKQNLFERIKLGKFPRAHKLRDILAQQPKIEKRFVTLVFKMRRNDVIEELGILFEQEEIQLMTSKLGVELLLFLDRFIFPLKDKIKTPEPSPRIKRRKQLEHIAQIVILLELGRHKIVDRQRIALLEDFNLLGLRKMLRGIQRIGQTQVARLELLRRKIDRSFDRLKRIESDDSNMLVGTKLLFINRYDARLARFQVGQQNRTIAKEIQISGIAVADGSDSVSAASLGFLVCRVSDASILVTFACVL